MPGWAPSTRLCPAVDFARGARKLSGVILGLSILAAFVLLVASPPVGAEMRLPAGFTARVYVSGEGFDTGGAPGVAGVPSASTLSFDAGGVLYVARTGRRYGGG